MLQTAELLRGVLVPFLTVSGSLLGVLFAYLLMQRFVRELRWRRRQRLLARYRPIVDAVTRAAPAEESLRRFRAISPSHNRIVAELLLAPLHAARGDVVSYARAAAVTAGLVAQWLRDLRDPRWWRRADGIRALGFVEEPSSVVPILGALDDAHREVRAAAVEASGRLGDPRAIPVLLEHLADGRCYQRTRMVEALRNLGPAVTPAVAELGRSQPEHARLAAEILGLIGTVSAIDPLVDWCGDPRGDVRAAALGALGSIGLDDRSHFFALRALTDADPQARAMAARALGRSRRDDAIDHLAGRLDDEWLPAAQAAGALRQLGGAGHAALQARANEPGQAGDLARQMLWRQ
jgi:HEAT repeat protein